MGNREMSSKKSAALPKQPEVNIDASGSQPKETKPLYGKKQYLSVEKEALRGDSRMNQKERTKEGWFRKGEHSYTPLLRCKAVALLAKSYPTTSRSGDLYQFKWFLDYNSLNPEEFLGLNEKAIKQAIINACVAKTSEGKTSKRMFYVVSRFLMLNGKEVSFSRQERKLFLKRSNCKKMSRQYIPNREDIYRMSDSFPNKGDLPQKRGKALILCLWQSGVRASCLCSWAWGMFKDKLYPTLQVPLPIKVVAERGEGVYDCAEDTKLSSYDVAYYYTFIHEEASQALKDYLEQRMRDGWKPKDSDVVFVTEGTVTRGKPLNATHLTELVKTASKQIGINPENIWTHCLRKSFRKTLYSGGVDPDVAEALMGHKLGASRGSYFDYHDVDFTKTEYTKGQWHRISMDRIRELEDTVGKLRQNGNAKTETVEDLRKRLDGLEQVFDGFNMALDIAKKNIQNETTEQKAELAEKLIEFLSAFKSKQQK